MPVAPSHPSHPAHTEKTVKSSVARHERESLRMELKAIFAKNRVDVHVQTDKELVSLWIARHELRGTAPAEIEARFHEVTGEALALTRAGFEIANPGDAPAKRSLVSPRTLMALANDIHRSGSTPGPHHVTVRNGYQYVVLKAR